MNLALLTLKDLSIIKKNKQAILLEHSISDALFCFISSLFNLYHLGPDSSIAWTSNEESSVRSEYLSEEENSLALHRVDSAL